MTKIFLNFLKRRFLFSGLTTILACPEPEPAQEAPGPIIGLVIDLKGITETIYLDIPCKSIELPYQEMEIDLEELLGQDQEGMRWLGSFNGYFQKALGQEAPMLLSFRNAPFQPVNYRAWPIPSYTRAPQAGLLEATLLSVPDTVIYTAISHHKKSNDNECFPCYREPKVILNDGRTEGYCLRNLNSGHAVDGVLLGKLDAEDLTPKQGDHTGRFPREHYFSIVYPINVHQINIYTPHRIEIHLVK